MESRPPEGSTAARWDETYRSGRPPWDIGRPQPAFVRLADSGEIAEPVLDCGCGTGEHALMIAERGMEVVGVDFAPAAIEVARSKAAERGLNVDFRVTNALNQVYAEEPSTLDPMLAAAQARALPKEDW